MPYTITAKNDTDSLHNYNPEIEKGLSFADVFVNRNYLIGLSGFPVVPMPDELKKHQNIRLFKVNKFVFNEDEDINDKLISVYSALQDLGSTAVLIIDSNSEKIEFYLGVYSRYNVATAGVILEKGLMGNFPGSDVTALRNNRIEKLFSETLLNTDCSSSKNVAGVSVIPSTRDEEKENFVQGIEKFIDTMKGSTYTAVILATPLSKPALEERKRGLEELYSTLSPLSGVSLSYGKNDSKAVSDGTFKSFSDTINRSVSNSVTLTRSKNTSESSSVSSGHGFGFGFFNTNKSRSTSSSTGYSSSNTWANAVSEGTSEGSSQGSNQSETITKGDSRNLTLNHENKSIKNLMSQIDGHLERIKECEAYGMWECAGYFISEDIQTAVVAANSYKALMSGQKSSLENSFVNIWDSSNQANTRRLLEYIGYCIHPQIEVNIFPEYSVQQVTPASLISGSELPVLLGLPRRSVTGVTSLKMAEFGRNVISTDGSCNDSPHICLGNIYHMGQEEKTTVDLDVNSLTSHCFISGSTGSGKSNTAYQILTQLADKGIKFLVIEPAKGEYKKDLGGMENINIFTTNPDYYRMLKINPFKFHENIHVLEHIDRLIEIFNACWPLYAAMPAILKDSVERAYERCGWDLTSSIHFDNGRNKFPTFEDVLDVLPEIINKSSYSADTKGDYIGSLVTRIKSLTVGITGQVFSDAFDIADRVLFDENTIVDISRVGSSETKSLIMGILVLKLNEYRMSTAEEENAPLKHVTVLEEAHNLLKRVSHDQSQESSNLAGKSVEMICNSIAEMRTYGEGFIIIDQSPTSVDISAIKNTNTKIIMRLPEATDCDIVGRALCLNDNQIKEISKLPKGKAVVWQNDWLESVLTAVPYCPKIKGEIQKVDKKSLAILNGKLVTELFKQKESGAYCPDSLTEIVLASELPSLKKSEINELLISFFGKIESANKYDFAKVLTSIINCGGMAKAIPCDFEGVKLLKTDLKALPTKSIKKWYETFFAALDSFVVFDNEQTKIKTIKYLLFCLMKDFRNDDRYLAVFETIFN